MTYTVCVYSHYFGLNRWKTASFTAQQRGKAALSMNESFSFKQPIRLERIGVNWLKVAYIAHDWKELYRVWEKDSNLAKRV